MQAHTYTHMYTHSSVHASCRYRRMKTSGKTEASYYNQRTDVYIQQEVVSIDSEELSSDPSYKPLDLSSVQQSSYSKLNVGSKSSDSTGITQGAKEYEYPSSKPTPKKKPKPKKKPSKKIPIQPDIVEGSTTTGNSSMYVNMEIMAEPPGGIEQSLTTVTSIHGYINVEHIAEHPGHNELLCTYFCLLHFMLYPLHLSLCTSQNY